MFNHLFLQCFSFFFFLTSKFEPTPLNILGDVVTDRIKQSNNNSVYSLHVYLEVTQCVMPSFLNPFQIGIVLYVTIVLPADLAQVAVLP